MIKPVYKNYKSGKLYTFVEIEEGAEKKTDLRTVFIDQAKYDSEQVKIDKNGRVYKLFDLEPATTKNGYEIYRLAKKAN